MSFNQKEDIKIQDIILSASKEPTACMKDNKVMFLCLDCSRKQSQIHVYFCSKCIDNPTHRNHQIIQTDNNNYDERCCCGDSLFISQNNQQGFCSCYQSNPTKKTQKLSPTDINTFKIYCFEQFTGIYKVLENAIREGDNDYCFQSHQGDFLVTFQTISLKQPSLCASILTSTLPQFQTQHICSSLDSKSSLQTFMKPCSCTVLENMFRHKSILDKYFKEIISRCARHRLFVFQMAKMFPKVSLHAFSDVLREFKAPSLFQALISQAGFIKNLANMLKEIHEKLQTSFKKKDLNNQGLLNTLLSFIYGRETEVSESTVMTFCEVISNASPKYVKFLSSFHEELHIITENLNFELIQIQIRSFLKNKPSPDSKLLDNLIYEYSVKCQFEISMVEEDEGADLSRTFSKINQKKNSFFHGNISVLGLLLQCALVLVYENLPRRKDTDTKKQFLGDLEAAKQQFKESIMRASKLSCKGIELLASGIITSMTKDIFKTLFLSEIDRDNEYNLQTYYNRLWNKDISSIQVFSMLLPGEALVQSITNGMKKEQTLEDQINCLRLFDWIGTSDICLLRSISGCFDKEMKLLQELKIPIFVQLFYGRDQCPVQSLQNRIKQYFYPFFDTMNNHSLLVNIQPIIPAVIKSREDILYFDNSLEDYLHLFANVSSSHVATLLPGYQSQYAIIDAHHHKKLSQESFTNIKEKHIDVILGNMIPGLHRHYFTSQLQDSAKLKQMLKSILQSSSIFESSFPLALKLLNDMILFNQNCHTLPPTNSKPVQQSMSPIKQDSTQKTSKQVLDTNPLIQSFEALIGEHSNDQAPKERFFGTVASKILLNEVGMDSKLISEIRNKLTEKKEENVSLQRSFDIFVDMIKKNELIDPENPLNDQKPQEDEKNNKSQSIASELEIQKQKAAERQKAILDQFSSKQKQFQVQNQSALQKASEKQENSAECGICRNGNEENILVFRAFVDVDNISKYMNVNDIEQTICGYEYITAEENDWDNADCNYKKIDVERFVISACPHLTHQKCHEEGSINMKVCQQTSEEEKLETFCTICKGLSNIAIPVLDNLVSKPIFSKSYQKFLNGSESMSSIDTIRENNEKQKNLSNKNASNLKERVKLTLIEMQSKKITPQILTQVQNGAEELLSILTIILSGYYESDKNDSISTSESCLFKFVNSLLSNLLLQPLLTTNMQQFQTKYYKLLENLYLNCKLIFKRQNSNEDECWQKYKIRAEVNFQNYLNEFSLNYKNKDEKKGKPYAFFQGFSQYIFPIAILQGENRAVQYCRLFLQYVINLMSLSYILKSDNGSSEMSLENSEDIENVFTKLRAMWKSGSTNSLDIQILCLPYFRIVSVFLQILGSIEESTILKLYPSNDLDPESELEALSAAFGQEFITLSIDDEYVLQLLMKAEGTQTSKFFSFETKAFVLFDFPKNFDEFYRKQFWKKCFEKKDFPVFGQSPMIVCLICGMQIYSQQNLSQPEDFIHINNHHFGVGAFVQLSDSRVVLIDGNIKLGYHFLYTDKFNRPAHCFYHPNWKDYLLNTQALNEIYQMITSRRIPQQIKYILMQKEDDPFYLSDDEDEDQDDDDDNDNDDD